MSLQIDWDDDKAVAGARGDELTNEDPPEKKPEAEAGDKGQEAKAGEDEGAEAGDKENAGEKEDEIQIPKSRFDDRGRQLKEERARIVELEAKLAERAPAPAPAAPAQTQPDRGAILTDAVAALDDQILEALKDGDADEAKTLKKEQRGYERELTMIELDQNSSRTKQETTEGMRMDLAVDFLEEQHPQLNPDNADEFDKGLTDKIQKLRGGFLATGEYTPTQALIEAVKVYIPDKTKADAGTSTQDEVRAARKKAALKKATTASGKQPPELDSVGDDSDAAGKQSKRSAAALTIEDLDKMSVDELKELRGDTYGG